MVGDGGVVVTVGHDGRRFYDRSCWLGRYCRRDKVGAVLLVEHFSGRIMLMVLCGSMVKEEEGIIWEFC